jgi:hypothetical protein
MQIHPFYFRGPLLLLFVLLFSADPSHSVVDEDVLLDDLLEYEGVRIPSKPSTGEPDGGKLVQGAVKSLSEVTNKLGEAPTPIQSDPTFLKKETADDGKVDTGHVVTDQNEVTSVIGDPVAPHPSSDNTDRSTSRWEKRKTGDETGLKEKEANRQKQDGAGSKYDESNAYTKGSDKATNSATDALKVAAVEKAEGTPDVSCICIVFIFDMHCILLCPNLYLVYLLFSVTTVTITEGLYCSPRSHHARKCRTSWGVDELCFGLLAFELSSS